MARLNWDEIGERFYEGGVDQGVLYINGLGHAWSGLISVAENPQGGEAKAYYIDGVKYANVAAAEEFEATISAFSSPKEFAACDGSGAVHNGLIATQQPRKPFSFAYRTKVGNDVDGLDHGYKIHLVYNALAAPSTRSHRSLGQDNTPDTMSWALTTLPPKVIGYRPTAHFTVDSRSVPPKLLAHVEDILFGSDSTTARLPTAQELVDLFKSEGPETHRNSIFNPAFRYASPTTKHQIRRNFATDPRATADVPDVKGSAGWHPRWYGNGGAGTTTFVTATDGPLGVGTYRRKTWTTAPTGNGATGFQTQLGANSYFPVTAAETIVLSGYLRSSAAGKFGRAIIHWYNDAGTDLGSTALSAVTELTATVWHRLSVIGTAPTGATQALLLIDVVDSAGQTLWAVGDTLDGTALLIERTSFVSGYFDGNTTDADGIDYVWAGTANASASIAQGAALVNWANGTSGKPGYKTGTSDGVDGFLGEFRETQIVYSNAVTKTAGTYWAARALIAKVPGYPYPATAQVRMTIHDGNVYVTKDVNLQHDLTTALKEIVVRSDVPTTGTLPRLYIYSDASLPFRVGRALMEQVSGPDLEPELYFDGNTPDVDGYYYSWVGVVDQSESIINSWN